MVADPSSICGWNPDMYGVRNTEAGQSYYDSLIEMYASRGVDFIKCDDICDSFIYRNDSFSGWHESEMLYKAIQKSNREIVLSLSPGPAHIDRAWQYCDMLPLGKVGKGFETGERDCLFTREEQKTMMTLWCMFRSPLMIVAELTKMDDFTLSLLTNKELSGREPDKDSYEFTELWSGEVLHSGKEALTVVVPAHGTKVFSVR
ncbi:hypothetical protein DXC84_12890 [Ruminococcus sp. TF08-4]|nr:hypothetical protein DXC84_12890 [Ruminococcus sp. TF08-4]